MLDCKRNLKKLKENKVCSLIIWDSFTIFFLTLRKLEIQGYFLNLIKNISKDPTSNIILNDERLSDSVLKYH